MALSMPKNQRDQIMLAVGIIGLALAGAYYYFVHTPKAAVIATLEERVTNLDDKNNRAKAVVARGTVEDMRAQAAVLRDNLELMRTLIPASNEVPALLDQIIAAARRTGLDFSNFQPVPPVIGEQFDTHRYRMSAQGSFHEIAELLTAIGSLRRIIAPVNVSLTPAQRSAPSRGARVSSPEAPLLNASFDIQTYVVKSSVPEGQ
jgi:type IV pilus assembly protein PilO